MEPPHGIDINDHLDLIKIVAASMPRAKWLLSDDVWPEVRTEGWLAMREALDHFDPAKGSPDKTPNQQFRVFAPDYIRKSVRKWQVRKWQELAGWYEPLESYDDVAARPPTPSDFLGLAADPIEAKEFLRIVLEQVDERPERSREVFIRLFRGDSGKEVAAELGIPESVVSERKTKGLPRLRKGVRRACQTPMKPKTVAEADGQVSMLAGNLALQPQLEGGMSIEGYELEIKIGKGGHAEVWRAKKHVQKPAKEQLVAIKRLLPQWEGSEDAKKRFEKEVRTSSKLQHPNIVQFHDCVYDNGSLVLVMEYVDGLDLAQLMAERPLSRNAAVYVIEQVLAGLRHAHGRGIVHRDIKPSNILVSREGVVKVSDFGIAQAAVTHLTAVRPNVTQGTRNWMSPEHEAGARIDERSDLYVVGRLLEAVLFDQLDDELSVFTNRLRAHLPKDRFQTAREALEALPACDHRRATRELAAHVRGEAMPVDEARPSAAPVASLSTAIVPPPHVVPMAQSATSRRATIAISVLAAIVLLLTGGLVAQRWADEGETQSPVVESVSEPAPAVESVAEPPSVVVIRELPREQAPAPEPKRVKRRPAKRPLAQPTKASVKRTYEMDSNDEAILRRVLNRPMPQNLSGRKVWYEFDSDD